MSTTAPKREGQLLRTDKVIKSKDVTLLSDVKVGKVETRGDFAAGEVTYKVDGSAVTERVSLSAGSENKRFGILKTWKVQAALPTLSVGRSSGLSLQLAGMSLEKAGYSRCPVRTG